MGAQSSSMSRSETTLGFDQSSRLSNPPRGRLRNWQVNSSTGDDEYEEDEDHIGQHYNTFSSDINVLAADQRSKNMTRKLKLHKILKVIGHSGRPTEADYRGNVSKSLIEAPTVYRVA